MEGGESKLRIVSHSLVIPKVRRISMSISLPAMFSCSSDVITFAFVVEDGALICVGLELVILLSPLLTVMKSVNHKACLTEYVVLTGWEIMGRIHGDRLS